MNTNENSFRRSQKITVTILVLTLVWSLGGAGNAFARFEDESDELPGFADLTPVR